MLLCLGAFAVVSIASSALVGIVWAACARWRGQLSARAESRLLFAAALAPGFLGMLALGVSLVPSLGWLPDHCLEHAPHHPHLCMQHMAGFPAFPLAALAGIMAGRWLWAGARALRHLLLTARTARALQDAAQVRDGLYLLPTQTPEAFVVGLFRPRIYVSRGLLDMPDLVDAVLAHERAHVRRRDPLRSWLASLALAGHLPVLAGWLARRLQGVQEMAADAEAAAELRDGPRVAQALVRVARAQAARKELLVGFGDGHIQERVHRLLSSYPGSEHPSPAVITLLAILLPLVMLAFAGSVHHAVETILGILS